MSEQKINFKNNYEGILLDRGYRIMWDNQKHTRNKKDKTEKEAV